MESFERQLLQMGRWSAVTAIVLTSICTTVVFGWQLALVVAGAGWTLLSVREVLESAAESSGHYAIASGEKQVVAMPVFQWVLDLPAMLLLVAALGLLAVFYVYVKSADKTVSGA
jgi:hypothetical protein